MLSRKEKLIMQYIIEVNGSKDSCLLTPLDISYALEPKYSLKNLEIQALIDGLIQENYISVVNSDKNGELVYCISLLNKGKSFTREQKNVKRAWTVAITRTIILAILSFVIGMVLKSIFS